MPSIIDERLTLSMDNTRVQWRAKVHEFSYNATPNIVPATQHIGTCQRKNTDKAGEALYNRALLGLEMAEIGAQQSKSAPESKLSYPADPSTDMYVVDLGLHIPRPTPIFSRRNC